MTFHLYLYTLMCVRCSCTWHVPVHGMLSKRIHSSKSYVGILRLSWHVKVTLRCEGHALLIEKLLYTTCLFKWHDHINNMLNDVSSCICICLMVLYMIHSRLWHALIHNILVKVTLICKDYNKMWTTSI